MGSVVWALVAVFMAPGAEASTALHESDLFKRRVAVVFQGRCLSCHNENERKGGLSLQTAESAMKGGDSGPAIVAGDPDASELLELVRIVDGEASMPESGPPLEAEEIEAISRWIASGAKWPDGFRIEEKKVENTDWWSFAPLREPPLPRLTRARESWTESPVDVFVAAKQHEQRLDPSLKADRRTWIRRVYCDLTGLPPDLDEVEAFVGAVPPDSDERLVDRLLASPRYGERWARHWLDVVHFGETHGYDKDKLRPNAWPYRDWVIRSFNEDKPYRRFVAEQIAGDILFPGTADGIEGLGFISAGPWDFIGHAELPETKIDGKIARHLDRDDMVANTISTFCSLTAHCAQCHHHKFDPITQEDYYRLQAVFAALDRADREYDSDPEVGRERRALRARREELNQKLDTLKSEIASLGGEELRQLDSMIASWKSGEVPPRHGYHSQIEQSAEVVKWVQVDLGRDVPIERVEVVGCYDDFAGIGAGFGFPPRYRIELSDDPEFERSVVLITDRTDRDHPNPKTTLLAFDGGGHVARYVRFTATKLAERKDDYILALSELAVWDLKGVNAAIEADVTALDSIESPDRWSRTNLVDGIYPRSASVEAELSKLRQRRESLLRERVPQEFLASRSALGDAVADVEKQLSGLPAPKVAYVGTVYTGNGTFVGTGGSGGKPRAIHVLARGDVTMPGLKVAPGAIAAVMQAEGEFELSEGEGEGARRVALAGWLTDSRHPLTWRSIVNRVWQYHFGTGIVATANDFGRMGQLPTHPELLDWLALEFRDSGGSVKRLHRLLVTSATYGQSSQGDDAKASLDSDNRYYWRANRRRLEAEAIRDSVLLVAGQLSTVMGGPSFQDFVVEKPEHSPHYEYEMHDPEDRKSHRRSIYRLIVRSRPHPFLSVLDCADPSMLVDKRNETISPLQSLALLNNPFMIAMSKHFAVRVEPAGDLRSQVDMAVRLALGRRAEEVELDVLVEYTRKHGLVNTCRLIFNLNEFVFVD